MFRFKKIYWLVYIFVFVLSCKEQKQEELVELYLLKNRIETIDGIPISSSPYHKQTLLDMTDDSFERYKNSKVDTVTNRIINAGKFLVKTKDLQEEPLIKNEDFVSFNFKKNEFILTPSSSQAIINLKVDFVNHTQFAITVDKKPVFSGYLVSAFSSFPASYNSIIYAHNIKGSKRELSTNKVFRIYKTKYKNEYQVEYDSINLINNKKLFEAFKNSNRIVE